MPSNRAQILAQVRTSLAAIAPPTYDITVSQVRPWLIGPDEAPRDLGANWWIGFRAAAETAVYSHGQVELTMPLTVAAYRFRLLSDWTSAQIDNGDPATWMLEQASAALDSIKAAIAGPAAHTQGGYAISTMLVRRYDESGMRPADVIEPGADVPMVTVAVVSEFSVRYHEPQGVTPP